MSTLTVRHLTGMLNGPLGSDVISGDDLVRGLLVREERPQDDGSGFGVVVWVTTLTISAETLTDLKQDDVIEVGPQRAMHNAMAARSAFKRYKVRKIGREDDFGARELTLAEVGR
jgi:hypothetical protein